MKSRSKAKALLLTLVGIFSCKSQSERGSDLREVTTYSDFNVCAADYACRGDSALRGSVTSSDKFYDEQQCVEDLNQQLEGACESGTAALKNFRKLTQNGSNVPSTAQPASGDLLRCKQQRSSSYRFVAISVSEQATGANGINRNGDLGNSLKNARRNCKDRSRYDCLESAAVEYGCVSHFLLLGQRQALGVGCDRSEARENALAQCPDCSEKRTRCAWDPNQ